MENVSLKPSYRDFNEAANRVFFDGRFSEKPLYLDLESAVLNELSDIVGVPAQGFERALCESVIATLDWQNLNIYKWHSANVRIWRAKEWNSPPPFTALLLVLSLAAAHMRADSDYSSNNYYIRLAELLSASSESRFTSLRNAGKYTLDFWLDLNRWLRSFDNEVGVPTATPVHRSWKYVSFALSQSLVRDGDKQRMHQMFLNYRLTPGDTVSPAEMSLYLDEWLSHPHSPSWLRRLWVNADLRDKVAQSASDELSVWEGDSFDESGVFTRAVKCTWVAIRKSFPKKRISLYSTVNESLFSENAILKVNFENQSFDVSLRNLAGTEEAFIVPPESVSLQALLGQNFELRDAKSEVKIVCQARPIIALCKVDDANYFKEVSRVRTHRPHMVLCHSTWHNRVEKHLNLYSNPSLTLLDSEKIVGIPSDWVCFSDVIFDRPFNSSDVEDNQIQMLVPFAELPSVQPIGGIKLSHGIWHANSTPSLVIPPIIKKTQQIIIKSEMSDLTGNCDDVFEESFASFQSNILKRLPFVLEGKSIVVSAGDLIRDLSIGFRTADNVKRKLLKEPLRLYWDLANAEALVTPNTQLPLKTFSEGLNLSLDLQEDSANIPFSSELIPIDQHQIITAYSSEYELSIDGGNYVPAQCILRGYHYWICEPYLGPVTANNRLVVCKDCGSRVVLPEPKRGQSRVGRFLKTTRQNRKFSLAPEIQIDRPHFDTIIDALCYKNEGSWEQLKGFLASATDTPEESGEYARRLSDLGVIDLLRNPSTGSISSWVVAPPVLVFNSHRDELLLTGFRSKSFLKTIINSLKEIADYSPTCVSQGAVTVHAWKGENLSVDNIRSVTSRLKDPIGRSLVVTADPSQKILANCSSLSELASLLPEYHLDVKAEKEMYNFFSGKWRLVEQSESLSLCAGAYRVRTRGNMYFYRNSFGVTKRASFEVAKTLAAKDAGIALHHYNGATFTFNCVLGADIPPLMSRALVISTGTLPYIENGLIIYTGVSEFLANAILTKIYQ